MQQGSCDGEKPKCSAVRKDVRIGEVVKVGVKCFFSLCADLEIFSQTK